MCYLVTFLIGHLDFDWCVVRGGLMNKHHENICLKVIELCLQVSLTTPHSITNIVGKTSIFS